MTASFKLQITLLLTLLIFATSFAQTGTIRGFVYEHETGEPVIFTNVYLKGTTTGAATDVNGYYSIAKVPVGTYTLMIKALGYDSLSKQVTVAVNQITTEQLFLNRATIELKTFTISAEKQEAQHEVTMSVTKVTPKEIKQMPTVGGEADIAQYIQVLPGVIFTGDQGGQLYIRGGSPIQNKVLLDGMVIYNPFHSIGLFSVFDTDIIRNADVYTGGFNAEYGGRISSIMDITTKDGNKKKLGGNISANTFTSKLMLEGPIKKSKSNKGNGSSFILSGKTSYLKQSSKLFYSYIDTAGFPYNFTDLYGKVSLNGANGSKVNLFGFNFRDKVNYQLISDLSWNAYGGGTNFVLVPSGTPVLVEGNFSYTYYDISLTEDELPPRSSSIDGFNLGLDFTYFMQEDEIKYGIDIQGFSTDFQFFNALNRQIQQQQNTTELGGYLKYKWNRKKWVIEPSMRVQYYASINTLSPEPRLGVKYNWNKNLRLKFAGGMYSQNLISAVSDRDVVNLFYGFLSGPDNLQDDFTNKNGKTKNVTHSLQKANHFIAGIEYDITDNLNVNVESYFKDFTQLTNINRNKLFDDDADHSDRPDRLKKDFIVETGQAYGMDVVLKYDYKRYYFWAVYSLGYIHRWDGMTDYPPVFDRRHNVNLLASYVFGKNRNWEINGRWNFGSGFPFTPNQGFYERFPFTGGIDTDYTTANGDLGRQPGEINSNRLSTYHRLDITLKRKWETKGGLQIEATAGATNLYNRDNIFYSNVVTQEKVDQLPLIPSIGLKLNF